MSLGRQDSSVGSVFNSDKLDTSSRRFDLAKILISETIIKKVPAVVCINGLTVTPQGCGF